MTAWPALMRRKTAADYLNMSEAEFERQVSAGVFPCGVMIGRFEYWRKEAIDAAIARIGGEYQPEHLRRFEEMIQSKRKTAA